MTVQQIAKGMNANEMSTKVMNRIDVEFRNQESWRYAKAYATGLWYGHDMTSGMEARFSPAQVTRIRNKVDSIFLSSALQ